MCYLQCLETDWLIYSQIPSVSRTFRIEIYRNHPLVNSQLRSIGTVRRMAESLAMEFSSVSTGASQMRHLKPLKGYANQLLDAARYVSILVMAHLSTYCDCYINKTLVIIFSAFLVLRQNFLITIPHRYTKNLYVCIIFSYGLSP